MKYKALYTEERQYKLAMAEAEIIRRQYADDATPRWYPGQRWFLETSEDRVSLSRQFMGAGPMMSGTGTYEFNHDNKSVVLVVKGTQGFTPLNSLIGENPETIIEHIREEGAPSDLPWWASWDNEEGWVY